MDVCLHFPTVFIALWLVKQKNNTLRFRITNYWHVTPCHLVQRLQRSRRKRLHHANLHRFILQKSTIPRRLFVFLRFLALISPAKKLQFLPYGRSIESWICLTPKTYTCHTVHNTIRYHIRFTGMKVRYTIFERVTMYNNAKRTLRNLQWFISTVILL
jgi:hypothetical protein